MRIAVVALAALLASAAAAATDELRAFERPKRAGDAVPARTAAHMKIVDSRRIATYVDRRGRAATLWVAKTADRQLCTLLRTANRAGVGIGGGCSPAARFLTAGRHVAASSGRLFAGVVSNDVARVVVVGSAGKRHRPKLTRDGGFIFDCRAWNGCTCVVAAVEAYAAGGKLLQRQEWLSPSCRSE